MTATLILTMCVSGWADGCSRGTEFVTIDRLSSMKECAVLANHYRETMRDTGPGVRWVMDAKCIQRAEYRSKTEETP